MLGGCNSVVEYLLPKQRVVGSNPITRSIDAQSSRMRHLASESTRVRDSLNKSPWMRRMDVKPVPKEGRGSRIRGNNGLQASCSEVP